MKEYLISVTFSVILCVGVSLIVPSPSYGGIMKIICGVFVVHTLLLPIKNISFASFGNFSFRDTDTENDFLFDVSQRENQFKNALFKKTEDIFREEICGELRKLYSDAIEVRIINGALWVYNAPVKHRGNIEKYLKDKWNSRVVFG